VEAASVRDSGNVDKKKSQVRIRHRVGRAALGEASAFDRPDRRCGALRGAADRGQADRRRACAADRACKRRAHVRNDIAGGSGGELLDAVEHVGRHTSHRFLSSRCGITC